MTIQCLVFFVPITCGPWLMEKMYSFEGSEFPCQHAFAHCLTSLQYCYIVTVAFGYLTFHSHCFQFEDDAVGCHLTAQDEATFWPNRVILPKH